MRLSLEKNLLPVLLAATLAGAAPMPALAVTYYISNSGNDANTGTSPDQAWQTLAHLDQVQYSMQPGDQILLERGGTYRGTLPLNSTGTEAAPIVAGAYGEGAAPIVSGSVPVTGWQNYQGNVWRAAVPGTVKQVYANGQFMTLARFPNSGWLRMDHGTSTTLEDSDLTQDAGYWTGATAVIRASNWNYDLADISGFSDGTLTFPTIYDQPGSYHWGYFLRNKLSELDTSGEWYFDEEAGMLYMQAPGNADPNSLQVEAAVVGDGAFIGWNREYIRIQDLAFRHQTDAGVDIEGGHHITVTGCAFDNMYHGIDSYGTYNSFLNSTYNNILATCATLIDQNSVFSGNQLNNIATIPGEGETSWGYFGVRVLGPDNTVSDNTLDNIGYIGIATDHNTAVERNVVQHCLVTLNDGGGISFDNTDGAVIQDNIVLDMNGNMESSAADNPNYKDISFGIYFGNTSIQNTLVKGNTVARCGGSGIHVDHTMSSTGIVIEDNVLFDNGVQLSISDWSNNAGPSAVPPYYVPSYNDVYSGNVLYSLNRDQLCMRQLNTHSDQPVDFGTFSNNLYYNPYNELSIFLYNTFSGAKNTYTLEQWQAEKNDDAGSTCSLLHLNAYALTDSTGGELVDNGTFNNNVDGWGGWPTNAEVTHDFTFLDNGALKADLPDASVYPQFSMNSPVPFQVESGQWYKMSFSLQSDISGQLRAAVKGVSQLTGLNTISYRYYPFSDERREIDLIFQSDLTDQAVVQFTNKAVNPHYWLDNVSVKQVQVQALDPNDKQILLYNDQAEAKSFPLEGCWSGLDGTTYQGSIVLDGFRSIVLVKEGDGFCDIATSVGNARPGGSFAAYPNPVRPGAWLHLTGTSPGTFRAWGINGQLVCTAALGAGVNRVQMPDDLKPGVYLAAISGNGQERRFKLVVQ